MIIDFHIHYSPEDWCAESSVRGNSPDRFCRWDPAYSFTAGFLTWETHCLYGQAGVDIAVLSSGSGLVNDWSSAGWSMTS